MLKTRCCELYNCSGWKRPPGPNEIVNLAPPCSPPNHIPRCHIHTSKIFHCFLGSLFQSLTTLSVKDFFPMTEYLSTTSLQVAVGVKVSPEPPLSFITLFTIYFKSDWFETKFLYNREDYAQKPSGLKCLRNFVFW